MARQKQTQEEKSKATDFQAAMAGSDKSVIVGSLRDMLYKKRMERQLLAAKGLIAAPERPPEEGDGALPAAGKAGGWVPPSLRGRVGGGGEGGGEAMMQKRRDENSVRVTNLSEDVTEEDLLELFGPFGPVQRIFVAKDRETGDSRGFAFVNFVHREDGTRAIAKLDGYGCGGGWLGAGAGWVLAGLGWGPGWLAGWLGAGPGGWRAGRLLGGRCLAACVWQGLCGLTAPELCPEQRSSSGSSWRRQQRRRPWQACLTLLPPPLLAASCC